MVLLREAKTKRSAKIIINHIIMLADYKEFRITCPACHADILEDLVIDVPYAYEILEYAVENENNFRLTLGAPLLKLPEEDSHLEEQESGKKLGE
jgi:hypothetical protein